MGVESDRWLSGYFSGAGFKEGSVAALERSGHAQCMLDLTDVGREDNVGSEERAVMKVNYWAQGSYWK